MAVTRQTDRHDPPPGPLCPSPGLLASYLDGVATAVERAAIESHVATCEDCYFVLAESMRVGRQQEAAAARVVDVPAAQSAWMKWVGAGAAIAAAVLLAIWIAGPLRRFPQTSEQLAVSTPTTTSPATSNPSPTTPQLEALTTALTALEASTGEFRPLEPRLANVSHYRPLQAVTRSANSVDERREAVRNAARAVADLAAASGRDVAAGRSLAQMYLATGMPDRAAEILEPAAATTRDAGLLSDLAAAYLSRGGPGDAARARDAAERAVERDPKRPEAWFNLALAAEALDQSARASDAWTKFLEIDETSGWAGEARLHLDRLRKHSSHSSYR